MVRKTFWKKEEGIAGKLKRIILQALFLVILFSLMVRKVIKAEVEWFDTYIISILKEWELVSKIEIKTVDEIYDSGIYKTRCSLIPSKYKLEIRFVIIKGQILSAYQLLSNVPIIRWDNSPHYPKIKIHPHHFHTNDGDVVESELTGGVIADLKKVLSEISKVIVKYEC